MLVGVCMQALPLRSECAIAGCDHWRVRLLLCMLRSVQDTREAESDMDVSLPLGGKEADSTPGSMMPTGPLADGGGGLRRSISAEGECWVVGVWCWCTL